MSPETPSRPNPRVWNRRLHRWGAVAIGVPFLLVIGTGLLLQVKKQVAWVQPPELRTEVREPSVSYDRLMELARAVPAAGIGSWDDVDRIDVRPGKGILKLIGKNKWELQMDLATGEVLQVAYRRSDFIETLHDMSWIHSSAKLWLGVPMGLIVLGLWFTGLYMWWVHYQGRKRGRHAAASRSAAIILLAAGILGAAPPRNHQAPIPTAALVSSPAGYLGLASSLNGP